ASNTATPDVIALAATTTRDGIANIPGAFGTGAFAVASANVGSGDAITATADTGSAVLPVHLTIPLDPAGNRVYVRFRDSSNTVRGASSVAVQTR
ncbi:MAG: hypothetical protein H6R11_803, partial [Proteobacteria bacterium]|nr:hypothetical protein [Pseudomonadota bacterium]